MTSFENILAFSQLREHLTEEQQNEIARALGTTLEEVERRMVGKDKEDEFVLILLFMEVCKSLSGFDEGISKLFTTATADLIVELKSNKKFLLEIKHTDKEKYSISSGNLNRRIDYADSFGLDLYFAISIKGLWMLFDSEYLKRKNGKIDINDYMHSKLDEILGTCSYMFPSGLSIKSVYMKDHPKALGIGHPEYGKLVSYELQYRGKRIFRAKGKNSSYEGASMILEALQDRMSIVHQQIEKNADVTVVTESFPQKTDGQPIFNTISEYEFLLATVRHTVNDNGTTYTAATAMETLKSDKTIARFQLGHIRGIMSMLVTNGVPIYYTRSSKIYEVPPIT